MPSLEDAIEIAVQAHKGQSDKAGEPYILHPLRIMCRMDNETEKIVAVLHDIVEDTPWTLDRLRDRGFPEEIVDAVDGLTKRDGESYEALIERACGNPVTKKIKIADLEDNMDVRRFARITQQDLERFAKYLRAWRTLTGQTENEAAP
ncbi:MAG: HD domain-containing protein [Deltaproteobacteria bacterium]|nr:HD domain-containing protein [Deltaproteobacteria bacterium]